MSKIVRSRSNSATESIRSAMQTFCPVRGSWGVDCRVWCQTGPRRVLASAGYREGGYPVEPQARTRARPGRRQPPRQHAAVPGWTQHKAVRPTPTNLQPIQASVCSLYFLLFNSRRVIVSKREKSKERTHSHTPQRAQAGHARVRSRPDDRQTPLRRHGTLGSTTHQGSQPACGGSH